MDQEIELSPIFADAFKHGLELARRAHVERHEDRRLDFAGERLDEFLGLFVQVGDGKLRAERAERLGATPGYGMLVGNADDQAALAFEQRYLGKRDHGVPPYRRRSSPFCASMAKVWRAIISSSLVGMT